MERLNNWITTYQQKICRHDRQIWEQSNEKDLFKNLKNVPRKAAKLNTSLIDVDLLRGSAYSVSKSQSGWLSIVTNAWLRLIFFPFCCRWWLHSTCLSVFGLLCILYVFQLSSLVVMFFDLQRLRSVESLTLSDFVTPYIMMYVLAVVHCMITANYNSPVVRHSLPSSNRKRSKAPVAQSFPSRVSENLSKSDQTTGKKLKEDHQKLQNKKTKSIFWSGVSNASLAFHDLPPRMPDSESDGLEHREDFITRVPSADDRSSSSGLDFSNCAISLSSPSRNESFRTLCDSEFRDIPSRNAVDLESVDEVCHQENEDLEVFEESCYSAPPSSSVPVDSLLTVVGSFEQVMEDDRFDCCADEERERWNDECESQNVPDRLSSKVRKHHILKSRSKRQNEISGTDGSMHTTFDVHTDDDDEGSRYNLSKLRADFEGQCCDVVSMADSNTSLSDTCNSSFVSSADDDDDDENCAEDREGAGASGIVRTCPASCDAKSKQSDAEFTASVHFGARQRRKPTQGQNQSPTKRNFEGGVHSSQHESGGVGSRAEKRSRTASETAKHEASSDEEAELNLKPGIKQLGSLLRQTITRKSCTCCLRGLETDVADETSCLDPDNHSSPQFDIRNATRNLNSPEKRSQSLPFMKSSSPLLNSATSATDKVSCVIWSTGGAVHKIDLTIFDIGWTIVRTVDAQQERCDYMILGILLSFVVMCMPSVYRIYQNPDRESHSASDCAYAKNSTMTTNTLSYASIIFGGDIRHSLVLVNGMIQRLCLSLFLFFLLAVAERTFKQRLLYAKYFCYLTSSRKAKKHDLPHFRLNKVRNIKTWLSLRSFLKKRGPQRSVETVVSSSFILAVILVSILCIELLQDYGHFMEHLGNWELGLWGMILGVYLLRFITLGTKINKKYRNLTVLITEQINLYLHMEQKPHKKASLMVANSVLKLAEGLLKELESPFKISGLSANPFLYNITKVVILSAFSAVLTELLGFKLKLYKIKIRS